MTWPQIDNSLVNESQTPGYIAELRAERIKDVKPAEYFEHRSNKKMGDLFRTEFSEPYRKGKYILSRN